MPSPRSSGSGRRGVDGLGASSVMLGDGHSGPSSTTKARSVVERSGNQSSGAERGRDKSHSGVGSNGVLVGSSSSRRQQQQQQHAQPANQLDLGAIAALYDSPSGTSNPTGSPTVQVLQVKQTKADGPSGVRYRFVLSDGEYYMQGFLNTFLNELVTNGNICKGCLIKLTEVLRQEVHNRRVVLVGWRIPPY